MDRPRIVVFSTTDLLAERPLYSGQEPIYSEEHEGDRLAWYSTGRLETAIALGHEIYVCSIRPCFGAQDMWWRRQVDRRNVFCTLEMRQPFLAGDADTLFMKPWRRLYERLGLAWDASFQRYEEARAALSRFPQIIDGQSILATAGHA